MRKRGEKTLSCEKGPNETNLTAVLLKYERRGKGWRCPTPRRDMKRIVVVILIFLSFFLAGGTPAEEVKKEQWQSIETKHTIIHYKTPGDLKRFNHKIRFSAGNRGFFVFSFSRKGKDMTRKISGKVDAIFERVQEILDMRKSMQKVVINIYHDRNQLDTAFFQIYQQPCRIRAWYRYWNNTIYINGRDLHEGMLAHEMAHAIIDHYMLVRPPRATAEILARYVDEHLEE